MKKDPLPNLLFFYGDSGGVISEGYRAVKNKFFAANPDGAIENFDADECGLSQILSAAQTSSLFARLQLLIVKNAENIFSGKSDESVQQLSEYCKNPNSSSHLIFLAAGMRKTAKVIILAEKNGWAVQCSDIPEWKITAWLQEQCRSKGITLNEEGSRELVSKIGMDISFLQRALENLSIYLYPGKTATLDDVRNFPEPGIGSGIFIFLDAVGTRNVKNTLKLLHLMRNENDGGILSMLYGRMRELLQISIGRSKGLDQTTLAHQLGLHPFRLKNLWIQSERFSTEELKRALKKLIQLQSGAISGRLGKEVVLISLENWILSLDRKNKQTSPDSREKVAAR